MVGRALVRLTSHRFGVAIAEALVAELTGSDHVRLEAVADLILDCETGTELVNRTNGKRTATPVSSRISPWSLSTTSGNQSSRFATARCLISLELDGGNLASQFVGA